jgi:PD-(D/E)XK nuclease superfamily
VELQALEKLWPVELVRFNRAKQALLRSLPHDDPLLSPVDLLHTIECASDETLHTKALAFALDPSKPHGFGKDILVALLQTIGKIHQRAGVVAVLKRIQKSTVRIRVRPEHQFRLEGFRNRRVARSDIWIEAKARTKTAVIVIENKIRASESDGQLAWYEHKVRDWCKRAGHSRFLLLFLTPDGVVARTAESQWWVPVSYLQVAAALRLAWKRNKTAAGRNWLGLYINSITQGVIGMRPDLKAGITPARIKEYLGGT